MVAGRNYRAGIFRLRRSDLCSSQPVEGARAFFLLFSGYVTTLRGRVFASVFLSVILRVIPGVSFCSLIN